MTDPGTPVTEPVDRRTRFPPPLIVAVALGAAFALHRSWPHRITDSSLAGAIRISGIALIVMGVVLILSALGMFFRSGTTPMPWGQSSKVVTRFPYTMTRNPMYLGLVIVFLGITLWGNSLWPFLFLPMVIAVLQVRVIEPEEQYLESKFGEEYRAYRSRVRRWL